MRNLFLKIPWWVYAIGLILMLILNLAWLIWGGE